MLSRCCINCSVKRQCAKRFINVRKGEFVYCPDGSRQLVDLNFDLLVNLS